MHRSNNKVILSATDLSSFFECAHRTVLDLEWLDRQLEQQRGREHEARVLASFQTQGLTVASIPDELSAGQDVDACSATIAAMERGAGVIYQGALEHANWVGRPDFLRRATTQPGVRSRFGEHLYEPVDAKLAREEKARAVLQLCAYADRGSTIGDSGRFAAKYVARAR